MTIESRLQAAEAKTLRLVYAKGGGVNVFQPSHKEVAATISHAEKLGVTITPEFFDTLVTVWASKALGPTETGTDPIICDVTDLPDAEFRGAWERGADRPVVVNMTKAAEIARQKIRAERAPLLAAQDVLFTRAQGQKDQAAADAAEAKRQALRDATADARLTAAKDPAALKAAAASVIADMKK